MADEESYRAVCKEEEAKVATWTLKIESIFLCCRWFV